MCLRLLSGHGWTGEIALLLFGEFIVRSSQFFDELICIYFKSLELYFQIKAHGKIKGKHNSIIS